MSPTYIPEPYQTIIKRLGNAYDTGFFMGDGSLFLAVILKEAAEVSGHPAQTKLVMEDDLSLHQAFIEITVDGTVFDLDIKGRSAAARALKDGDNLRSIENGIARQPNESYLGYLQRIKEQARISAPDIVARLNDPSRSFLYVRDIGFNTLEVKGTL